MVHMLPAFIQPIAADGVVSVVVDIRVAGPLNTTVEIAGPERLRLHEFVRRSLYQSGETHEVIMDVHARYFGSELKDEITGSRRQPTFRFNELRHLA